MKMKTENCTDTWTPPPTELRRKLASDLRDAEWETAQELLATARSLLRRIAYPESRVLHRSLVEERQTQPTRGFPETASFAEVQSAILARSHGQG